MQKNADTNRRSYLHPFTWAVLITFQTSTTQSLEINSTTFSVNPARLQNADSIRILNEIAKPTQIKISAGEDPLSIVRSRCGTINTTYVEILKKENPDLPLGPVKKDTTMSLPACFIIEPEKTVSINKGDNLSTIANRYYGSAGTETLTKIVNTNAARLNCKPFDTSSTADTLPRDFDDCILYPGKKLALTDVPVPATYIAKELSSSDLELQKNRLNTSLQKDSPNSVLPGVITVFDDLVSAAETDAPPDRQCHETEATELYPRAELIELLKLNDRNYNYIVEMGKPAFRSLAVVVVADSGLAGFGTESFPESTFRTELSSGYMNGPPVNYGVNIYNKSSPPIEFDFFKNYGHGTHVAGIARGGANLSNEHSKLLSKRIKLLIASMLDIRASNSTESNFYSASTPSGGIKLATDYAQDENANVLNISFTSSVRLVGLEDGIKKRKELLVIASAGNSGINTDYSTDVFPFSYGGVNSDSLASDQLIVVAAHQKNGQLTPFSSYGIRTVDLAAPGCRVASNSVSNEVVTFSGTSEAAPAVAFTAGLLRYEGIVSAKLIKARIVASLDRSAYLESKVAWGGKLNVIKALNVYNDVIELRSAPGKLLTGRVSLDEGSRLTCGGRNVDITKLSKIYRNSDIDNDDLHALITGTSKSIRQPPEKCTPKSEHIQFTPSGGTDTIEILWADVLDLIPSYYPYEPQI